MTNDDGVDSPGIVALARALHRAGHELLVVAPTTDLSGTSAAIGPLHRVGPLPVTEHSWDELGAVPVFALDAPPAAAVYAACLGGFGERPDLVASGINPGANTGHLVLHSGTVGAALTAAELGVPGLAVSVKWADDPQFETAAALAAAAVQWVTADTGGKPRVLNLNAPDVPLEEVRGVRQARLAPYGEFWVASADHDAGELHLEFKGIDREPEADTDWALIRAGYATVTALAGIGEENTTGAADAIAAALG